MDGQLPPFTHFICGSDMWDFDTTEAAKDEDNDECHKTNEIETLLVDVHFFQCLS